VTVGLLANGKSNGMVLLDRIAELLRERRGIGDVVRLAKANASVPSPRSRQSRWSSSAPS